MRTIQYKGWKIVRDYRSSYVTITRSIFHRYFDTQAEAIEYIDSYQ